MIRFLASLALLSVAGCTSIPVATPTQPDAPSLAPRPYVQVRHPDWAKSAVLYQINTRQFTEEGTFAAAEKELPRLKDLGVDILWLMPINPS